MPGSSFTHGAHEVAQKLISVTLPRKSLVETISPLRVANFTSGAALGALEK